MLTQETVDRIRSSDGEGHPILSVYLGLRPGVGELRSLSPRLKDLMAPVRASLVDLPRDSAMSLRADIEAVMAASDQVSGDLGRGVALFRCSAAGIDEYVSLPGPVRDRAVTDLEPYLRPLYAMLEHYHSYCAVVIGRRKSSIFRFRMGELETWEEMAEEEVRKQNYGGFSGYEEGKTRNRAEEIAHRHYRDTAQRLRELDDNDSFDLLLIGGPTDHVDGLVGELDSTLRSKLAGTFTIDPGTMTPAAVRTHCEELSAAYDRKRETEVVAGLLERAGSGPLATVGVDPVLGAVNQRAVAELVVQGMSSTPGRRCSDCGWLVSGNGAMCPACGEGMRDVPDLLDAMATAVRLSGGSVQNVITETPLMTYEVGAVLRYAVPQVDPQ